MIITALLITAALSSASAADSVGLRGGGTPIGDFEQFAAPSSAQHLPHETEYEDGPCLDSFPLASLDVLNQLSKLPAESYSSLSELPHDLTNNDRLRSNRQTRQYAQRRRNLSVSIPTDETRTSYAPLCDDGKHIDIRKLVWCTGGSCYDECFQTCTFVCTWNALSPDITEDCTLKIPDITDKPTTQPTTATETYSHNVLLKFELESEEYCRLTPNSRQAIISFLQDLISKNLEYNIQILNAKWPGYLPGEPHSLPLEIHTVGPTDVSDFALSYILETIRDNSPELLRYLKNLDGGNSCRIIELKVDIYDPNDIFEGETNPPSSTPTKAPEPQLAIEVEVLEVETNSPSSTPTKVPQPVEVVKSNVVMDDEEGGLILWWIWLLVTLGIGLCCCGAWYCTRARNNEDEKNKIEDEKNKQHLNVYVGGGHTVAGYKPKPTRRATHDSTDLSTRKNSTRTRRASHDGYMGGGHNMFSSKPTRTRRASRRASHDEYVGGGHLVPYRSTSNPGSERMARDVVPRDPTLYVEGDSQMEEPVGRHYSDPTLYDEGDSFLEELDGFKDV